MTRASVRRGIAGPTSLVLAVAAAAVGAGALAATTPAPALAATLGPVNPVTVPVDGHPANQGFLVFVEGDVRLAADEAEGTLAAGGDLTFDTAYNIGAGSTPVGAPTFPGDDRPTYLSVGGGIRFPTGSGAVLRVLNGGLTHVGDTSTYDAFDVDQNGAAIPYRLVPEGATAETTPRIEGTVAESPADVARTPHPSVLDPAASFARYRTLSTDIGTCPATTVLTDDQGTPLDPPVAKGSSARVALRTGVTNVLTVAGSDLDALSLLTFDGVPGPGTPLVVNVTGASFDGSIPNLANLTSGNAPFVLWNFPDATSVHVTGADALEGTIYAPRADLRWDVTQNIEGNVVAASFTHGVASAPGPVPLEIHGFPFAATVSCVGTSAATGTLTLVKRVAGGSADPADWTLTATAPGVTVTGTSGSTAVTGQTVPAGDYTLGETGGPDGYSPGPWTCVGAVVTGSTVTITDGADAVCTVVNTAVPPGPSPTPEPTTAPTPTPDPGGAVPPTADPTPPTRPTPPVGAPAGDRDPGAPGGSPAAALAFTGDDPKALGLVAAALLTAGAALLPVARRARRRADRS